MSGGVLGGVWALLGALLDHLGSKLVLEAVLANFGRRWKGQDGAKMHPESTKMGHVGAKLGGFCGQEAPKKSYLAPCWELWKRFGEHFDETA